MDELLKILEGNALESRATIAKLLNLPLAALNFGLLAAGNLFCLPLTPF